MSHTLKIFGSGDELLETEGDISAEHQVPFDITDSFVAVSDGSVFRITSPLYHPPAAMGIEWEKPQTRLGWGAQCLVRGKSDITIDDDGKNDFIELVSEEPFRWVVFGIQLEPKELIP